MKRFKVVYEDETKVLSTMFPLQTTLPTVIGAIQQRMTDHFQGDQNIEATIYDRNETSPDPVGHVKWNMLGGVLNFIPFEPLSDDE